MKINTEKTEAAKQLLGCLPVGSEMIGVIEDMPGRNYEVVVLLASGVYVGILGGASRTLDQQMVKDVLLAKEIEPMSKEDFEKQEKAIEQEREQKLYTLCEQYAKSNNTVRVGDIVEDNNVRVRVEKIGVLRWSSTSRPMCKYYGPLLTKKGVPLKSGEKGWAHQRG